MTPDQQNVVKLTSLVRLCFQRLRTIGDQLHADLGMNSSLRAVLEWLTDHGSQTVPQIAAAKSVSRQHIQKIVDELIDGGHVDFKPNPAHKRSPFVVLTPEGAALFKEMRRREKRIFRELAAMTDTRRLPQTVTQLERFTHDLSKFITGDKQDADD
jgi:DNA-binding MarR family transcriptional regulator